MFRRLLIALAGAAAAATVAHAAPDAALLAAASAQQAAVIDTLHTLVLIESGSADAPGCLQMASTLEARLKALGFATERRKASTGTGADIVVGMLTGTGTKRIMLQAHIDTV